MATEQQIAANRENAKLSTGPRTDAGKAASSSNASKHGLATRGIIIAQGQQDAFDLIESDLRGTLLPEGPLQEFLFKRVLTGAWNLYRCGESEKVVFNSSGKPRLDPLLDENDAVIYARIHRYAKEAENSMYKAMRELARIQEEAQFRKEANQPAQQPSVEDGGQLAQPVSEICSLQRVRKSLILQRRNEAKVEVIGRKDQVKGPTHRIEANPVVEDAPSVARAAA